ncbi:hypothetical protein DFH08DRAFT_1085889, partial [Mycena albidolilacea]
MLLRHNNWQYARSSDADAHSDHACSPPHSPTFLALSQPQPPLLSLHAELLELVVLHDTSAHSALRQHNLGIESHAQLAYPDATPRPSTDLSLLCLTDYPTSRCKPMTGFLNVEAGSRAPAARPSLSTYVPSDRDWMQITPRRTKQLIVWESPVKMARQAPCRRPMP